MRFPVLTVDLDGVLASPPLGLNLPISRSLGGAALPVRVELTAKPPAWAQRLVLWAHRLSYAPRRPLPGVAEGLAAMARWRELVLVTGRSWLGSPVVEGWLLRHGLREYFSAVYTNNTRLNSAQFKLWKARQLGAAEHVDDDGSVVYYLARSGLGRVFLQDWPRNRGLPYPPQVVVVRSLAEVAEHLSREARQTPGAASQR